MCDDFALIAFIKAYRVKSGKFGQSVKFEQRPCLFHVVITGIKANSENPDETAH